MQLEAQDFLVLVEAAKKIAFWDIEATGLRGDYNSVLCVSVRPFMGKPKTFAVKRPGDDQEVVREAGDYLSTFPLWCTYFGKGFDVPMMNTRRLRWGYKPMHKRHHIDLYYTLKANLLTARRSQGHLLSWLNTPEEKMTVSASVWSDILAHPKLHMKTMIKRCESDTDGLQALYLKTRHLICEITR